MVALSVSFLLLLLAGVAGVVFIARGICMVLRQQIRRGISYIAVGCLLVALVALLILPVTTNGERSPGTKCMSNLSQIGKGLKMYSMDQVESFPPSFLDVANYITDPTIFVCPRSGNRPGGLTGVNDWTDYVYVSGLTEADPSESVSAYCLPKNHGGKGANVLFVDGSVQWLEVSNFVALTSAPSLFFGTTNETALAELQRRTKIIRGAKQIGEKR